MKQRQRAPLFILEPTPAVLTIRIPFRFLHRFMRRASMRGDFGHFLRMFM